MKKVSVVSLLLFVLVLHTFAVGKREVTLRLTETSTFIFDETTVYLDLGTSPFNSTEDGQKIFDTSSSAPLIYSFSSDNVSCFSNSYGNLVPNTIIPLGFKVSGNGFYSIRASLIDNFDPASIIRLEDRKLGVFYDLRQGNYNITINQATQDDARFFLHVSTPPVITVTSARCNNDDGAITVAPDLSVRWSSVTFYDDSFNLIVSYNNVTTNVGYGSFSFGDYNVVFALGNYTTIKPVYVDGESVSVEVSATTTHTSVGQPVQFFAAATNTTNYLWDFGEGSQIGGIVNPTFSFDQAGVYDVTVVCSNAYGCSYTQHITIIVDEATSLAPVAEEGISVTAQNKNLNVIFSKPLESNYNLQVFNSVGQQFLSAPLTKGANTIDLSHLASGVYIAHLSNEQGAFSKKIVLQ